VTSLVDVNRAIHATLDDTYIDCLEALFAGDLLLARAHLGRFIDLLHAHMETEERFVLPRFLALGPVDDDPHALAKIEGDHLILRRTLSAVVEALASVNVHDPRRGRALAAHIDVLSRLKGILEHHSIREERDLYPRLDASLDADTREHLSTLLEEQRSADRD